MFMSRNIIFNEETSWPWYEDLDSIQIERQVENEAPPIEVQQATSLISSPILASLSLYKDETPSSKFKLLVEIYETS